MTVTVCIETSIYEMHYCCRGIGAYKHLSFAILWKVRYQYNPKLGLCCFFKIVLHYPPNIYLFRVVYFLYIVDGVLGNIKFSCLPVLKAAKELVQLNTPILNASDYKFQP